MDFDSSRGTGRFSTGSESSTSRFEDLLRSLWQCHVEELGRLSAASSENLPRIPPSSPQTSLPNAKDQDRAAGMIVSADATDTAHKQKDAGIDGTESGKVSELSATASEVAVWSRGFSGSDLGMKQLWEALASHKNEALIPPCDVRDSLAVQNSYRSEESEAQPEPTGRSRWISPPGSLKRMLWDIFGGVLVIYDMIKIPLAVFEPPPSAFTDFMDWLTLIFWSLDVPASFFVGYYADGDEVMEPRKIAKNYLTHWFLVDIGVVIPDWIFTLVLTSQSGDTVRLLRSLRIVRILRLVRLLKLKWIIDAFIDYADSEAVSTWMNIIRMLLALLCINHFLGCVWYAIGSVDANLPAWTDDFEDSSWEYLYCLAMHWSVTQFTPASMSIQPANIYERTFAICVVFFALVVFSYIVGSITGSLSALREMGQATSRQFWHLRRYLKRNHVSPRLSKRITQFILHAHTVEQEKMDVKQVTVMRHLSQQLMAELKCAMTLGHLELHPLFAHLNETANITLNSIVKDAVSQSSMARSDILFLPSKTSKSMYFVKNGRILYTRKLDSGETKTDMVNADEGWIAEPALWCATWVHVGEAKAKSEVDLLLVDSKRFEEILNLVRPLARLCAMYARAYLSWLRLSDLSDVIQGDQEADRIREFIPKD